MQRWHRCLPLYPHLCFIWYGYIIFWSGKDEIAFFRLILWLTTNILCFTFFDKWAFIENIIEWYFLVKKKKKNYKQTPEAKKLVLKCMLRWSMNFNQLALSTLPKTLIKHTKRQTTSDFISLSHTRTKSPKHQHQTYANLCANPNTHEWLSRITVESQQQNTIINFIYIHI